MPEAESRIGSDRVRWECVGLHRCVSPACLGIHVTGFGMSVSGLASSDKIC